MKTRPRLHWTEWVFPAALLLVGLGCLAAALLIAGAEYRRASPDPAGYAPMGPEERETYRALLEAVEPEPPLETDPARAPGISSDVREVAP